jgi:hypothetical protein
MIPIGYLPRVIPARLLVENEPAGHSVTGSIRGERYQGSESLLDRLGGGQTVN